MTSLPTARPLLALLVLAGLLTSCDGGGGKVVRLSFGTANVSACRQIQVDIDLEAAGAELAHLSNGSPDCALDAILDDCDVAFEEVDDGAALRVTIANCEIPLITSLFQCGFTQADLALLEEETVAGCDCEEVPVCHYNSVCNQLPPVCIDQEGGPTSCEDCGNGIDDDGNGDIDCDDDDCEITEDCGWGWTTITCPSSTVPSTTLPTTTTVTLPLKTCAVVFRLADDVTAGSLQWTTAYVEGAFAGSGALVECESPIAGSLAAFNDDDASQQLESGIVKLDGFDGPVDVAVCTFESPGTPTAPDFVISDVEAATPDLQLIEPAPDVVVASIDCGDGVTTTTNPVTTTTTGNPTTTIGGTQAYDVLFKLDSADAGVGALQWTTDYAAAVGGFEGSGASVACTNKVAGALFAPNDSESNRKLTLGTIALSPFSAPTDLAQCVFEGSVGDPPVPGDFAITIDDATDTEGTPISVSISMVITPQ